jgi:hypothetical protein
MVQVLEYSLGFSVFHKSIYFSQNTSCFPSTQTLHQKGVAREYSNSEPACDFKSPTSFPFRQILSPWVVLVGGCATEGQQSSQGSLGAAYFLEVWSLPGLWWLGGALGPVRGSKEQEVGGAPRKWEGLQEGRRGSKEMVGGPRRWEGLQEGGRALSSWAGLWDLGGAPRRWAGLWDLGGAPRRWAGLWDLGGLQELEGPWEEGRGDALPPYLPELSWPPGSTCTRPLP